MSQLANEIQAAINGRNGLVYLQTSEEKRVLAALADIARDQKRPLRIWNCIAGLDGCGPETANPVLAVQAIIAADQPGFFVFCDISEFLAIPETARVMKEFMMGEKAGTGQFIFMVNVDLRLPETLRKHIHLINVPPPEKDEVRVAYRRIRDSYPQGVVDDSFEDDIIGAMTGLVMPEIETVLHRAFKSGTSEREAFFEQLFEEKRMAIRKTGYLEFTPPRDGIDAVGGLGNLKEWLLKRQKIFTREAMDADIPIPKGLLVMGVSGCGKSMAVKAIPALWQVPLYRLDMNLVFSGIYGSPEATFHHTLRALENAAPAVLWIDEIENALGMDESGLKISTHIFSSFLTWMQEKPPLIFIAATANRIQALPAEILRKGRFDQIFFVDLPSEKERIEIFTIYLRKHHADVAQFDLKMLAVMTKGWNGAEIDQVVAAARTDAFYENRAFNQSDVAANINQTVPLSTTMESQIKAIRNWALSRATPASGEARILRY